MRCFLEKRKKFLPCVLHKLKDEVKLFIAPNMDVIVNSTRSIHKTGYFFKTATTIDVSNEEITLYTSHLDIIPLPAATGAAITTQEEPNHRQEENNNEYFVSRITIPCPKYQ